MNWRTILGRYRAVIGSGKFDVQPLRFLLRSLSYNLRGQPVFAHHRTQIVGLRNLVCDPGAQLLIGIRPVGFLHHHDRTYLHLRGTLSIGGKVNIGRGCRLDIAPGARCRLDACGITGLTNLIIAHSLEIGRHSVVSWGCEFVDSDWHALDYPDKREVDDPGIVIGEHVWIGSHVKLLKGVRIGSGSVVAAGSVVTRPFPEERVLIAGNPAQIVRRDVRWGPDAQRRRAAANALPDAS